MNNANIIKNIIALIGIGLMAFAVGRSDKTGESVNSIYYIGMILAVSGVMTSFYKKR